MQSARAFGERIQEKLRDVPAVDGLPSLHVPGNFPYKERRAPSQTPPVRHEARCTMCGQCVAACPMGAITMQETVVTDPDGCVVCCACVKSCPAGARTIEDAGIRQIAERLTRNCRIRQAPEFFM